MNITNLEAWISLAI